MRYFIEIKWIPWLFLTWITLNPHLCNYSYYYWIDPRKQIHKLSTTKFLTSRISYCCVHHKFIILTGYSYAVSVHDRIAWQVLDKNKKGNHKSYGTSRDARKDGHTALIILVRFPFSTFSIKLINWYIGCEDLHIELFSWCFLCVIFVTEKPRQGLSHLFLKWLRSTWDVITLSRNYFTLFHKFRGTNW